MIRVALRRKPYGHFNLIHPKTGLKADVYTNPEDALHAWAFGKIRRVSLPSGFSFCLAPPEYVILRKLEYFREGGSEKHL